MDKLNEIKYSNGGFIQDLSFDELNNDEETKNICKAIRRFFPSSLNDEELIKAYYTNDYLLQDLIQLELKKHILLHLNKLVQLCKMNLEDEIIEHKITDSQIKRGIFGYFNVMSSDLGLFNSEIAWFLSDVNGGGIFDSDPLSDICQHIIEQHEK